MGKGLSARPSNWTVQSYNTGATGCDAPPPVPAELRLGC